MGMGNMCVFSHETHFCIRYRIKTVFWWYRFFWKYWLGDFGHRLRTSGLVVIEKYSFCRKLNSLSSDSIQNCLRIAVARLRAVKEENPYYLPLDQSDQKFSKNAKVTRRTWNLCQGCGIHIGNRSTTFQIFKFCSGRLADFHMWIFRYFGHFAQVSRPNKFHNGDMWKRIAFSESAGSKTITQSNFFA